MERGGANGGMNEITDGVHGVNLNGDLHGMHAASEQSSEEVLDNGAAAAVVSNHAVVVTNVAVEIFDNQLLKVRIVHKVVAFLIM